MFGMGIEELIVILVILLIFTGGKKLPELSRGMGQSIRELRKGFMDNLDGDDKKKKGTTKKTASAQKA